MEGLIDAHMRKHERPSRRKTPATKVTPQLCDRPKVAQRQGSHALRELVRASQHHIDNVSHGW